jgi:hypothetical protein
MAINLKEVYDSYYGDASLLTPAKGNTPFGYYDNDPEFTSDARAVTKFVAQRLGVTGPTYNRANQSWGASPVNLSITDLTVYASFEEAITTYGNLVYQYKIRDNYINIEGSDTLPFFNNTNTYVNSDDVNSPISWSAARKATWAEIGYDQAYSQSVADGEVWAISSSIADYIAPDLNLIKSFNLADRYYAYIYSTYLNLSQYVNNQFNQVGGATIFTSYYNINSGSYNFSGYTTDGDTFSVTGSNTVAVQFKVTSSNTQIDTPTTYYVVTGSTAANTTANIASKISSISLGTFGTYVTASNSSTTVSFTSSLSNYNIRNFKINNTAIFSNITSGSNVSVPTGNSHIYFYVTTNLIAGNSTVFLSGSVQQPIPTIYMQSNINPSLNNKLLSNNLTTITSRIANDYAAEAGGNGHYSVQKGLLSMKAGIQDYDLNTWAAASASLSTGDTIEIRKIFYEQSPAIARYFDPYAGTGTGIQSLLESFGFGQMSPGINFMLMPISFDVMKLQAIELNDTIRKAAYSFDLVNNQLKIFPVPQADIPLYFEYVTLGQKSQVVRDTRPNIVTDVMNVPYRNPIYSNINTVGRSWIFKYTLALCREIEAHLRIQYSNMTIGGVGPLQGNELITDARTEKENLLNELKEMLNEVSRKGQLERKSQEAGFTRDTLTNVPTTIYIM